LKSLKSKNWAKGESNIIFLKKQENRAVTYKNNKNKRSIPAQQAPCTGIRRVGRFQLLLSLLLNVPFHWHHYPAHP